MAIISRLDCLQLVSSRPVALVAVLFVTSYIAWSVFSICREKNKYKLPNLVPGLPIIGNVHQLPSHDLCLHVEQLAKTYGDM